MSGIAEWVKNYSMVFLLMTVLTSAAAKKEYGKYIRLFVETILIVTLAGPFFGAIGKSEDFFEKISFENFWQGLDGIKKDREKMDFLNDDYYISYYEDAIEADVALLAENSGYAMLRADVALNDAFEVEEMELVVAKEDAGTIVIGTVEEAESAELAALREKIAAYYQIDAEKISILD